MPRALLAMLMLTGCMHQPQPSAYPPENALATTLKSDGAQAFVHDETDELAEFRYTWPPEAAAIPPLAERLRGEMAGVRADLRAGAEEDRSFRKAQGIEFHRHMSSTVYETAGQSARLLSLSVENGSYTGGAHGNFGAAALLWDRQLAKEVGFNELFVSTKTIGDLLFDRWCAALNIERERKRGQAVGVGGLFDDCPNLDAIAILPTDKDNDGKFEILTLIASPYIAGPWAEGAYQVELPVTPTMIAAMKSEYQPSFGGIQTQ